MGRSPAQRAGWSALAVGVVVLCCVAVAPSARALRAQCSGQDCLGFATVQTVVEGLLAALWIGAAVLVLLRGPASRVTAVLGLSLLAQGASTVLVPALDVPGHRQAASAIASGAVFLALLALATFPDGRFVPFSMCWVVLGFGLAAVAHVLVLPQSSSLSDIAFGIVFFVAAAAAVLAQVHRYRRVATVVERRQTMWVVYGLVVWLVVSLLIALPYFAPGTFPDLVAPGSSYDHFQTVAASVALAVIPVTVTIAAVHSKLFDIDVVLSRTLVYATLSFVVGAGYLLVVGGTAALLGSGAARVAPLVAAALVALVFQPLRAWLQRRVRRLVYGLRDEPYAALTELGRRLAATVSEGDVQERVVTTIRDALRVPFVAVALRTGNGYAISCERGTATAARSTLPLVHRGEEVGLLLVDDDPAAPLTDTGRALLADLARQAGPAISGVRLTESLRATAEQLQTARERLVVAREEERRRLRRDLHDELAPTLAAAGLTASAAVDLLDRNPEKVRIALDRLCAALNGALADIRRLVDELRPVQLDEVGLLEALRQRADALHPSMDVVVESVGVLPELPAAVEVAAYRICSEGLMNVLRHSRATCCRVRLNLVDGSLLLEVADNGVGIPDQRTAGNGSGVGLSSMHERAAELGGRCSVRRADAGRGTLVSVQLPLAPGVTV